MVIPEALYKTTCLDLVINVTCQLSALLNIMTNNRYPPAYLRYLKARLMNLARPGFWGTAIFLSVVGLLIHEYWANPDIFGASSNTQNESDALSDSLTDEERAIAADIDNLPLLFGRNQESSLSLPTNNSSENKNKNSLLESLNKQSADKKSNPVAPITNSLSTPQNSNLFVSQTENILRFGASDNNQLLGLKLFNPLNEATTISGNSTQPATGLTNQPNQNQNSNLNSTSPTNSTQIDNQTNSGDNSANVSVTNSINGSYYQRLVQTAPTITAPNQTISPITNNYLQQNNFNNNQRFLPNTGITSTTNYLQPSTVNPPSSLYNTQPFPSNAGLNTSANYVQPTIQPGIVNNFNNSQVTPNQVPTTSSVITGTSPIIGPYTVRNSRPTVETTLTPLVPNNYGNSTWQQPNQFNSVPPSNSLYNRPNSGQNINGLPNNGY